MINDETLELLGDYFEAEGLLHRGWTFIQFVEVWQRGYISIQ